MYSAHPGSQGEGKEGRQRDEAEILLVRNPLKKGKPSLFWALCRTFGPHFLVSSFYKMVQDVLMFVGPEILR